MTDSERADEAARKILGADRVLEGEAAPDALDGPAPPPRLTLYPESREELSALVKEAQAAGLGLIPWGGGTKQHHGYPATRRDWVVNLSRLSGMAEHQEADFVATLRAGATLRAANEFLAERAQFLPLDPLEGDGATLGGICAANSSGPLRLGFGTPRDLVLGMEVVMADGTPVRFGAKVVKSVAGFDLNKLYIGSLGTLGFITEVTLKTFSLKVREGALLAGFDEAGAVQSVVTRLLSERILPVSLEWLTGGSFASDALLGEAAGARNILLVSFRDNDAGIAGQLDRAEKACRAWGVGPVVRPGPEESDAVRKSLSRAGPFHASARGPGFACRVGVPLTRVGETVERARMAGEADGFRFHGQVHAGNGIIRMRFGWEEGEEDPIGIGRAERAVQALREAAARVGGYAVIETRSSALRDKLDLFDETSVGDAGRRLMQRAKLALDPKGIMNPGRFFGRI
jgi:glycolate oxidase FAD binding subunit